MDDHETDHHTPMLRALELAAQGGRDVMPNPMVGCVIIEAGEVIGEGFHQYFGEAHAEVNAINSVLDRSRLSSATLYVNLEPCSHFGKTPPCVDLIISSKIPRVVVGSRDPFPAVSGQGISKLKEAGIEVVEGILAHESAILNKRFMVAHQRGRPYIILKWAQTNDGFIARPDLSSRWISCAESRQLVHQWRADEMAILVGTTTAQVDNPSLTVRHVSGRNPVRVVIDANLSLSPHSQLFDQQAETIVFNARRNLSTGLTSYVSLDFGQPITPQIAHELYKRNIISLIVEGGAKTLESFVAHDLWDEARVFTNPVFFGEGIAAPKLPCDIHESSVAGEDTLMQFLAPWSQSIAF